MEICGEEMYENWQFPKETKDSAQQQTAPLRKLISSIIRWYYGGSRAWELERNRMESQNRHVPGGRTEE